jgi:hypothetical protein
MNYELCRKEMSTLLRHSLLRLSWRFSLSARTLRGILLLHLAHGAYSYQ